MNIYWYELKFQRKSALIWLCSLIGLAAMFFAIFPSIAGDAADFKELLSNYPATVREMLGINLDYITSILGFYSMIFSFILLCGTIQAMNLGVSILSKETRERTADFLLVKPVSRTTVVSAKLLSAITTIVITDLLYFLATFIMANIVNTEGYSGKILFLMNFSMFLTQMIFLAIGTLVSLFFQKIKNVLPISLGFVLGFYMAGALLAVGKNGNMLRFLSPFKYYDITYIIKHSAYEMPYLILGVVIIIVCIAASYTIYIRKDIHAV
jgi:Putative exporter of polyketide antibiotics